VFAVLRVAVLAVAIVLGVSLLAWLLTGDPRWRRVSWLVFKYAVFVLAAILVLFAGEALLEQRE
jgi:cell division protein FtsW (lipid II flippase)